MAIMLCLEADAMEFDFEAELTKKDQENLAQQYHQPNRNYHQPHTVVCRHWLRNLCMKGEQQCPYLHYYDPNRMPECQTWLRYGKCTDPDCIYRHTKDETRPDCENYKYGFCKLGNACRLRHEKRPRRELPEVVSDYFLECIIAENVHLIPKLELKPTPQQEEAQRQAELPVLVNLPEPVENAKTKFVFIKSGSRANLDISIAKAIWATTPGNSEYLDRTFRHFDHVILIMTCKETKKLLGYAKMLSLPDPNLFQNIWGTLSSKLAANFRVHWMKLCVTPYENFDYLKMTDPNVGVVPFYKFRDGMTLTDEVGTEICKQLTRAVDVDLLQGTDFGAEPRIMYDPEEWRVKREELLSGNANAPSTNLTEPIGEEREVVRAGTFEQQTPASVTAPPPVQHQEPKPQPPPQQSAQPSVSQSGAWRPPGQAAPAAPPPSNDGAWRPPGAPPPQQVPTHQPPAATHGVWRPPGAAAAPPVQQQPNFVPPPAGGAPPAAPGGVWRPPGAPAPPPGPPPSYGAVIRPPQHHPQGGGPYGKPFVGGKYGDDGKFGGKKGFQHKNKDKFAGGKNHAPSNQQQVWVPPGAAPAPQPNQAWVPPTS